MLVSTLKSGIDSILNDLGGVTYTEAELLCFINDGQRLICDYRPDAKSSTLNLSLVAGPKQTITGRRLISCVRNMGADGSTPGSIIRLVNQKDLDTYNPEWMTEVDTDVVHYVYDETRPNEFYVYPSVTPTHYIEVKQADNPTDVSTTTDSIDISEIYAPALISWVVYRILSRDRQDSPNTQRAMDHKATTFDILGIKMQSDSAINPNARR